MDWMDIAQEEKYKKAHLSHTGSPLHSILQLAQKAQLPKTGRMRLREHGFFMCVPPECVTHGFICWEDGSKAETWIAPWWGERTAWAMFLETFTQVLQSAVQKFTYYTYRRSHFHLNLMEMMFSAPWMELCSPGEVTTPIWRSWNLLRRRK